MSSDLRTQLRNYAIDLDDRSPSIEDLVAAAIEMGTTRTAPQPPKARRRRRLLSAVAAAIATVTLVAGIGWLAGRPEDRGTEGVAAVMATLSALTIDDIPGLRVEIAYDSGFVGDGDPAQRPIHRAEIVYSPGRGYRLTLLGEGEGETSYRLWDGTYEGWYSGDLDNDPLAVRLPRATPLLPPSWQGDFSARCPAEAITALGRNVLAGRVALGVSCSTLAGDWNIWVDEASGVLLRLEGAYGGRDDSVSLVIADLGWLEVQTFEVDPEIDHGIFSTDGIPDPDPGPDAAWVIPFHATVAITTDNAEAGGQGAAHAVLEAWYRNPSSWEVAVLEADALSPFAAGPAIEVQSGDQRAAYYPDLGGYHLHAATPGFPGGLIHLLGPAVESIDGCAGPEPGERLGRPVGIYTCTSVGTADTRTVMIDSDTGLVLFASSGLWSFNVLEFDADPVFPSDVAVFDLPGDRIDPENPPQPLVGASAPGLQASSLDGAAFDLADLRGSRVAVLFGASWCPPCLDALQRFAEAHEIMGSEVAFVAVASFDDPASIAQVASGGRLDFTVLLDPEGLASDAWMVQGFPTMILIDPEGTVVAGFTGQILTEDILSLLLNAPW